MITNSKAQTMELPPYILEVGKDYVLVNVRTVFGREKQAKITRDDLAQYFREEAFGLSGVRVLGGLVGDWRKIDELAHTVSNILQ